jgi:acyl-CoA synthetase (AMP-forming)/AMP-acid ligase II
MTTTRLHESVSATFSDILAFQALTRPDRRAFAFLNERGEIAEELSFAALDARAHGIAAALQESGQHGSRILLSFPPGLDFVAALFGCFHAGCIAVPAPQLAPGRENDRLQAICRDCEPGAILTLTKCEANDAFGNVPRISVDKLAPIRAPLSKHDLNSDSLAILQYTSGSTSAPKGVMITHGNLLANNAMIQEAFQGSSSSVGVSWLPLFHDMGLVGHVLQPVYLGITSILMSPLSFLKRPLIWLHAISKWRATISGAPSYAYELCCQRITSDAAQQLDLSSWEVAYCGSEKVRPDVLEAFAARFSSRGFRRQAFFPCYGLAETTLMATGGPHGRGVATHRSPKRAGAAAGAEMAVASCGPVRDRSVAIVEPERSRQLNNGKIGEIWIRGPHVSKGYWRREAESAKLFDARLDGQGGYLRTGDLGFIADGELFVIGRLKDTIVIRGKNHAPEDIEATVAQSHEAYAAMRGAAFVVDAHGQERLVVVQEIARSIHDPVERQAAAAAAFEQITRRHGLLLHDFVLVGPGSIPRTSSGKVRRRHCREMYEANRFERLTTDLSELLGMNRLTPRERVLS